MTSTSTSTKKPYLILSLDGGGVRALLELELLMRLTEKIPNLMDNVDLLAGTSAGSIVSVALASGKKPSEISEFLHKNINTLFQETTWKRVLNLDNAFGAPYTQDGLKSLLDQWLGDKKLKDFEKKLIIPSFRLDNPTTSIDEVSAKEMHTPLRATTTTNNAVPLEHHHWCPEVYHNFPGSTTDDLEVVEICLRSGAAPTYFPIRNGHIDGGMWSNNPCLLAVTFAVSQGIPLESIYVLSLSTGLTPRFIPASEYKDGNWGFGQWAKYVVDLLMDATLEANSKQTAWLIGERFLRIDPLVPSTIALDTTDESLLKQLVDIGQKVELQVFSDWIEKKKDLKDKLTNNNNNNNNHVNNNGALNGTAESTRSCTIV